MSSMDDQVYRLRSSDAIDAFSQLLVDEYVFDDYVREG